MLTVFIDLLKSACCGIKFWFLKGPCSWGRSYYAVSPFAFLLYWTNWLCTFNIVNIALSCFFPLTGPYTFPINSLGATTEWKFIAWIRLCPLNNALWLLVEACTLVKLFRPQTPNSFPKLLPLLALFRKIFPSWTVKARFAENLSESLKWKWSSNILLRIALDIKKSSGAERPHRWIMTVYRHG